MSFFADLPPQLQERVVCSISAAVKYEVPVNIVWAIAEGRSAAAAVDAFLMGSTGLPSPIAPTTRSMMV